MTDLCVTMNTLDSTRLTAIDILKLPIPISGVGIKILTAVSSVENNNKVCNGYFYS